MNNITIGREGADAFAYYETIGGGSGAGPSWSGASGLHVHMTNTLNTPVEALEHEYPFRVERYAIREGSGGTGSFCGGDGVIRAYRILEPAQVTLMTERRARGPYGLQGGAPGKEGRNLRVRDGVEEVLPAKGTFEAETGDLFVIETPGGGGWGSPGESG
jgi:N-methylhydantoinase B